ncbi:MBL fold metallo-hydrolase [Sphingomonas sp.]|jgi:L-ascorbate metabolism protein UlaG (beta-lactamase superfamily)|uniref:MBL fold metallo-hydrolase n=1 Tax=Sphingomonas sp. TaxID=28214 RepID=UPI002D7E5189|nr:MBL fold metallo-hydrolase [Sphingomonas sp.]HEU0044037.1 MBL fold metallo-hydrolase [Sphingomonas sp.]
MTTALKILGGIVLLLLIVLGLAVTIVPRFLDRIYYRGDASDHFDGERFFNPGVDDTVRPPTGGSRAGFFWNMLTRGDGRPAWPSTVSVTPSKPAARVEGERMVVTWIGHATVLVQTNGLNILTDPVWSDRTGPFGRGPKRVAAPGVRFDDLPKIDLVLLSHNHYDHLDKPTLKRLWARDKPLIVTSLGNDSVIGQTGAQATAIDWGGRVAVRPGVEVHVTRNHHWGSRWFTDRNRALWSSFTVTLPGGNLYFAGDTGLGDGRWPAEAAALGPVRFAIIPIGAFRFVPGQMTTGSHIGPADAVRVFAGLGAATALPIHWGTFRLSYEGWDTPPRMLDLLMRCTGADPARFAAKGIGETFEVPVAAPAPVDTGKLDACLKGEAVRALP